MITRLGRSLHDLWIGLLLWAVGLGVPAGTAVATEVLLKDGRVLRGKIAPIASLAEVPKAPDAEGAGPIQLILLVDDDLRRTFVSKYQIQPGGIRQDDPTESVEKFTVWQKIPRGGHEVQSVGPVIRITPFDEFGRRTFTFGTRRGKLDVVQGISQLTPRWAKVEGLNYIWEMRVATSSLPQEILKKILYKQIDPKNVEHRKKVARFYLQSERYEEARKELESILKDFPDEPNLQQQLAPTIRTIRQLAAQRLIKELQARREAGQHRLVYEKLKTFPSEDVASEILQAVRALVQEYDELESRRKTVLEQFEAELAKLKDSALRNQIEPIRQEIAAELNVNTLDRMAAFSQNMDDPKMTPEEKVSLAISGWLLGADTATGKLPVALSVYRVRDLVRQYLNEPVKLNRAQILGLLRSEEGAVPRLVAALIAHMKPAVEPPEPISPEKPGYYAMEVSGLPQEPPVRCLVQVPPEYDAFRRYPAVVTLHGAGTTTEQQLDWWVGSWTKEGWRAGQASRQGYIVIAPDWTAEHQKRYGYSAREHAAVLNSLREACRRFSIDTDRVFISGHSMGGDAAWDLGLAHPDLWAGVIPIVAQVDRYCARYWENAESLPFYVVAGELDGDRLIKNARDLDRYLRRGYNCTVVEYLGRGHEHFYEEILDIFDWMRRFRRDFFPREFNCVTMRQWDNYFWWVELDGLPPASVVDPIDWPPPRGTQPMRVSGKILNNNGLNVRTGSSQVTVWLAPQMVNFDRRTNIVVNGRRVTPRDGSLEPDLATMLEDVRTRGDRQHPFWAKVQAPTDRVHADR
jgi:pimeloyl-ACP methyl ester carboxylesterase